MMEKASLLPESSAARSRRVPPRSSIILTGFLIFAAIIYNRSWLLPDESTPASCTSSKATKILKENPLIDGHNDLAILVRFVYGNDIGSANFTRDWEKGGMLGHVDLPRLEKGMVGGQFWSAFIGCPEDGFDFSDKNYASTVRDTLEQIDLLHRLGDVYPKQFTRPENAREAEYNWRQPGQLISPLGIEGLHQIGNSPATLRLYHSLGVRYATLTWNCHNKYADAALVSVDGKTVANKPYHGGVSKAGHDLILEMNRIGMLVDLSHVSVDTMRDVLGGSAEKGWNGSIAPPIFSHSSAKAICPHPRNVPDDILHLLKKKNGVVMINFSPDFVSCSDPIDKYGLPTFVNETNTLDHVVKHIMYVGELIGYDHVGLGTDYDGIPTTPRGLEDVSKFPDLVAALLDKGVSEADAGKIVGRNVLRVWHEADEVAARLQKHTKPLLDDIEVLAPSAGSLEDAGI